MINLSQIQEKMQKSLKRLPVCLAFLAALTIQLITKVIIRKDPDAWTFFFGIGMLVALLLHLMTEKKPALHYSQIIKDEKAALLWAIPFILLGIDSYFLHTGDTTVSVAIAQSAAILALILAVCFLPFYKEKDDRMSWNFVQHLVMAACLGVVIGGIMCAGLEMLYYGTTVLFGITSSDKVFLSILILCMVTLPSAIFFIRIPEDQEMYDPRIAKSRFLLGTVRYLFLPLALMYLAVLYVYGAKILFTWTLPKGMLSTLVSILMFVIIAITFLLYPYLHDENHKGYEVRLTRMLPLLVLPLLVLMSVGIGRRFYDYGITDKRLYLLTLNIWFYIVAIGLWVWKAHRIHWVSISFAAILVLTSCHPWNFNNIYQDLLISRINTLATKYNIKIRGLDNKGLKEELLNMTDGDARKLFTTLDDVQSYDYKLHSKLGLDTHLYESYDVFMGTKDSAFMPDPKGNGKIRKVVISYDMAYEYKKEELSIPTGYHYMKHTDPSFNNMYSGDKPEHNWETNYGINCNDSTFVYVTKDFGNITIRHKGLKDNKPVIIPIPGHKAALVIKSLAINDDSSNHKDMTFCLDGYFFYNK